MSNLIDHLYGTAPFMFNDDESGKSGNGVRCGCGEEFVATHDEITGPIDSDNNTNHLAYERLAVHIAKVATADVPGGQTPRKEAKTSTSDHTVMFEIWADPDPSYQHSIPEIIDSWADYITDDNPDGYREAIAEAQKNYGVSNVRILRRTFDMGQVEAAFKPVVHDLDATCSLADVTADATEGQ